MTAVRTVVPRRVATLVAALVAATTVLTACGPDPTPPVAETRRSLYAAHLHERLPADLRSSGVLEMATDASYAPASSFAADGRTIVGFEPDLAQELGAVLGVRVRMVNADFSSLIDQLNAGRYDAVMSAMTDNAQRQRAVDFVDYFSAGTAILVQRGNPQGVSTLADLCGKVVAAEEGTVQVDLLARSQRACSSGDRIQVRTFRTNSDALVQLRTGRAVAVLNDYPPAVFSATDPRTRGHFQLASTTQYEPGVYGIAVRKNDAALREVLVDALRILMREGVYSDVLRRWSVADGAIDSPTVNSGSAATP